MIRLCILATFAVLLATSPASAECAFKFQNGCAEDTGPSRHYIRNTHNQIVGDIYDDGTGRRLQIRTNQRVIIGYIEPDGTLTNIHRQEVLSVESLGLGIH